VPLSRLSRQPSRVSVDAESLYQVVINRVDIYNVGFHMPWLKIFTAFARRVIGVTLRRFGVQRLRPKTSVIDAPRQEHPAFSALSDRRGFMKQMKQVRGVLLRQALILTTIPRKATRQ